MASDFTDVAVQKSLDTDILRVYPGALVQIYNSVTGALAAEVTADADGVWSVASLPTGQYDIKVDGVLRKSVHHVKSDHTHVAVQTWRFFKSGAITADQQEVNTMPVFGTAVAGAIERIIITVENVDSSGDMTVHLLAGQKGQASTLTIASDSIWNYQVNPGSSQRRFMYVASPSSLNLSADDTVTLGIDWTANTVEGLTVTVIFRPAS
jgi:hypothetical protein